MAKLKGAIVIDTERCKGCEVCVSACPEDVIAMAKAVMAKGITTPNLLKGMIVQDVQIVLLYALTG